MQDKRLISFLFFACLALLGLHRLHAYDIWWQIAAGEWILAHGFPLTDPFSYGFPDGQWIEPRWIFCVAARLPFTRFGVTGLILAKLLLAGLTFGALWRWIRPGSTAATLVGCTFAVVLMQERLLVRPELVSFLALALTLGCLARFRSNGNRAWLYLLPAVQLIWCNAHTLWILGPVVQWTLWFGDWVRTRRLISPALRATGLAALASTAVVWLNPWGLRGALFPLRLFRQLGSDHLLGQAISEFLGPFSDRFFAFDFRTISYLTIVVLSAGIFGLNYRKLNVGRLLLWCAFLVLSFKAQRNVALFGLVAGWATIENLAEVREFGARFGRVVCVTTLVGLLTWTGLAATDRYYVAVGSDKRFGFGLSDRYPIEAIVVARRDRPASRIFNTIGDGGYVLFEGGEKSVYVDGRLEVYDPEEMATALAAISQPSIFRSELERVNADRVLVRLPGDRMMLEVMEAERSWLPIFYNSRHVLYAKRGTIPASVIPIDWQQPEIPAVARPPGLDLAPWPFPGRVDVATDLRLAALYVAVGSDAAAEQSYLRVLDQEPANSTASLYLGLIRRAQGRDDAAERLLSSVPATALDSAEVQLFAADLHRRARRADAALGYYRRAIELGAARPAAEIGLVRAALAAGQRSLALQVIETLRRDFPLRAEPESLFGVASVQSGELETAIEAFERSFSLDPEQPQVARMIADLYARLGDSSSAVRWRERADLIESRIRATP